MLNIPLWYLIFSLSAVVKSINLSDAFYINNFGVDYGILLLEGENNYGSSYLLYYSLSESSILF